MERPPLAPGGVIEEPVLAKPPGLDILLRLEHLITAAPLAVQRCIAGMLVLLAFDVLAARACYARGLQFLPVRA